MTLRKFMDSRMKKYSAVADKYYNSNEKMMWERQKFICYPLSIFWSVSGTKE